MRAGRKIDDGYSVWLGWISGFVLGLYRKDFWCSTGSVGFRLVVYSCWPFRRHHAMSVLVCFVILFDGFRMCVQAVSNDCGFIFFTHPFWCVPCSCGNFDLQDLSFWLVLWHAVWHVCISALLWSLSKFQSLPPARVEQPGKSWIWGLPGCNLFTDGLSTICVESGWLACRWFV